MTGNRRAIRYRGGGLLGIVAVSLLVAACGGSSGPNKPSSPASSPPASSGGAGVSASLKISTAKGSLGTYLIGTLGKSARPVYLWSADTSGKSACSGACASTWPPVISIGTPSVSSGVTAANLGTITRSDGKKQVTYNGHPLYFYAADSGPGTTSGEGLNSFGAKWWLVSPSGAGITKSASAKSSSGGSSGGSSSGGGWG